MLCIPSRKTQKGNILKFKLFFLDHGVPEFNYLRELKRYGRLRCFFHRIYTSAETTLESIDTSVSGDSTLLFPLILNQLPHSSCGDEDRIDKRLSRIWQ